MARYGQAVKDRAVARLLPPESAALEVVAREVGVGAGTLERWREDAQSRPARGRAWTAGARLEAVITTAAMNEAGKSAWCREHGVYPADLDKWRASCTTGPNEATPAACSAPSSRLRAQPRAYLVSSRTVHRVRTSGRGRARYAEQQSNSAPRGSSRRRSQPSRDSDLTEQLRPVP